MSTEVRLQLKRPDDSDPPKQKLIPNSEALDSDRSRMALRLPQARLCVWDVQ
jgi:hypothetical protein